MLFSVYQLGSGSIWFISEYTAGSTFCYISFPDSLSWVTQRFVNGINRLSIPGNEGEIVAHTYDWEYMEIYSPDQETRTEELFSVSADGVFSDLLSAHQPDGCGLSVRRSGITMTAVFGTAVRTGESQTLPEFVAVTTSATSCLLPDFQTVNSSEVELGLYRRDDQSSLETIWQRDITGHSYSHFMYHPHLPGHFFAFVDGELAMLRAADGAIRYSVDDIPTGAKSWDFPYDDGLPRLVVINEPYISFYALDVTTGVGESPRSLPGQVTLEQNYPNPFNSSTTITFELPVSSAVDFSVFNLLGQRVVTLINEIVPAGTHTTYWDGTDESGSNLASGVYFYRLKAGDVVRSRKLLLLK